MTRADMFDPTVTAPTQENYSAFTPLVQTLIRESNAFGGPVYLINGDSHVYNQDHPLAAKNLTRVTVYGSDNAKDWLKVTTTKAGAPGVLSFERIPFTNAAS